MKVVPKRQRGGNLDSFFTTYVPVLTKAPSLASSQYKPSLSILSSEKGKLTEKDFFDMLKDIDGLPNEMSSIVGNLISTFLMSNLTGVDSRDLATLYLLNLYLIKVASLNKKTYDDAIATASKNGAMAEPAISMDGGILILNDDGSIGAVSIETFNKNRDLYLDKVLTVSLLAYMRKSSPSLAYNLSVFDIINNSMGYEAFQELLGRAILLLGSTETTKNGMFSVEGKASQGLALLQTLREDDRVLALGSITANGLYEYKIIDKNLLSLINALTRYITTVLPNRAKTWAAVKTGLSNKDEATRDLVLTYLLGRQDTSHSFDIDYAGSMSKVLGSKSSSSSEFSEDPKEGFWRQVQAGRGGEDFTYTILTKNGRMSVNGKYYGTTPGMDNNKSLGDYINDSKVGFLIKNNKNITFGDAKISTDSFNDVMIKAHSGAVVVSLPIKLDGTVDLAVAERWVAILDELKNSGLVEDSPEYKAKLKLLVHENLLDGLLDSNGLPSRNRFGHFLVLEGIASEKTKAAKNNELVSFKDALSDFIISAGDDSEIYDMLEKGLSNKDRGKYELNRNWDWSLGYDELYEGNIYIPLNTNPINAYNADNNDIKLSTSLLYEKALLKQSTSSGVL